MAGGARPLHGHSNYGRCDTKANAPLSRSFHAADNLVETEAKQGRDDLELSGFLP